MLYVPAGLVCDSRLTRTSLDGRCVYLPGAQPVLSHPLLLQLTGVLQFNRTGDEAHLAALLHQTADPPVVVVLLQTGRQAESEVRRSAFLFSAFDLFVPL